MSTTYSGLGLDFYRFPQRFARDLIGANHALKHAASRRSCHPAHGWVMDESWRSHVALSYSSNICDAMVNIPPPKIERTTAQPTTTRTITSSSTAVRVEVPWTPILPPHFIPPHAHPRAHFPRLYSPLATTLDAIIGWAPSAWCTLGRAHRCMQSMSSYSGSLSLSLSLSLFLSGGRRAAGGGRRGGGFNEILTAAPDIASISYTSLSI